MDAVERAAEVINTAWEEAATHWPGGVAAQALADAGLLLSDADRAVLEAAEVLRDAADAVLTSVPERAGQGARTSVNYERVRSLMAAQWKYDEATRRAHREAQP